MSAEIAHVALDVPLPKIFDYAIPPGMVIQRGSRVEVPLGPQRRVGIVVEIGRHLSVPPDKLRFVHAVLGGSLPLTDDWFRLAQFAADYYQRPLGEVVLGALPPRLKQVQPLLRPLDALAITTGGRAALATLTKRASVKRAVLEYLVEFGVSTPSAIAALAPSARAIVRDLVAANWIERVDSAAELPAQRVLFVPAYSLTPAQASARQAFIDALGGYAAFLLHGVTGSGKTEVYLHLIHAALERGLQALMLVPEINLTPHLEREFRSRFPATPLAVMHSARADNERALAWLDAQEGRAAIVLGTRLAAFTPFARLGVIIVDEENDPSFKQQDGVRYSARDLAVFRAHDLGIPVVLGSATPSLESYFNAKSGRYHLAELPTRARAGAALPSVSTIDLRHAGLKHGVANELLAAIGARLERREQSLIFINRRGYAPVLGCGACGWVSGCARCAAHLVVHLSERALRCHHCGHVETIPRACPVCGNVDLSAFGRGTQRVEDFIAAQFPQARVLRIDSDSTRTKGSWDTMLSAIQANEVDILVGTQILAKGHDFARLTLVGVLNADAALMAADYRAPERLFSQLHQVSGRAGRAELPGEVLIQTRYPAHPLYQALAANDYARFAEKELADRTAAGFPPAVAEAVLRAEAYAIDDALKFLRNAIAQAPADREQVSVFDPVAMSMPRLADWERAHVLVQSPSRRALQNFLGGWTRALYAMRVPPRVRWHVDVDPTEF